MKPVPVMLLLLLLISAVYSAEQQRPPAVQKQRQVLYDFREDHAMKSPRIPAATQRLVLSKVFRKYLTDENKCSQNFTPSGDDYLASARNAGQIVPSVSDLVTGSFTAPGQTETAYLIFTGECGASHAENYGSKRIAIFAGQQLVADVIDQHALLTQNAVGQRLHHLADPADRPFGAELLADATEATDVA